jgi:Flp pilus assembly protein TadD
VRQSLVVSANKLTVVAERRFAGLAALLLLVALLAAYANHFQNSFHFDDAHTVVNNAAIRDLSNIPSFFRDATTFSALPSNQSYRPLVSTLLAIDYRFGGGLQPFWFHVSVFKLFVALVILLGFFVYHLLESTKTSPLHKWIATAAAACYGLHPANADTVNYIIASAEVISTLGVLASFAVYCAFPRLRWSYLYVLPAALAVFAKPPAAIFPVLFAVYRAGFRDNVAADEVVRLGRSRGAASHWWREVLPPFLICGALLWFVQHMTPRTWVAGAADARHYLLTQPYVTLLYFKTFFWPSTLSADYDLSPFATIHDARFWAGLAFTGFLVTAAIVAVFFRKTRTIGFGLSWFLLALLPTSLLPLAEVMNDHRTFMPYVGLVIALAGAASLFAARLASYPKWTGIAAAGAVIICLATSGYATFQRNKVWLSEETLWRDVVMKSPRNARGLMNYGNTLMAKGDFTGALDHFHRAQLLAPQYPVLLINLAIAEDATKQAGRAEQHFREALRLAPSSPDSYTYYARTLLEHSRKAEARALLRQALSLSPGDVTAQEVLAEAESSPESYLALSLQRYQEGRYAESIAASRAALALQPNYAEAWNNLGAAYNKLGQYAEGADACEKALLLRADFELARNNLQYAREMMKGAGKK